MSVRVVSVLCVAAAVGLSGCYRSRRPPYASRDAEPDVEMPMDASSDSSLPPDASDDAGPDAEVSDVFCDPALVGVSDAAVYADSRGVYVLVPGNERRLYVHRAGRWSRVDISPTVVGTVELASCEGGPLFEYGHSGCAIREIRGDSSVCSANAQDLSGLSVVAPMDAYGAYMNRAIHFDGVAWRQLGDALSVPYVLDVWSDGQRLVFGLDDGVLSGAADGSGYTTLTIPGQEGHPRPVGVTGSSSGVIWWTATGRVLRHSGSDWSTAWESDCSSTDCDAASFDDVPYFWGESYVVRYRTGTMERLGTLPCGGQARFTDVSASAQADGTWAVSVGHVGDACGEVHVHHWP